MHGSAAAGQQICNDGDRILAVYGFRHDPDDLQVHSWKQQMADQSQQSDLFFRTAADRLEYGNVILHLKKIPAETGIF